MHWITDFLKIAVSIPLLFFLPGFFLLRTRAASKLRLTASERYLFMVVISTSVTSLIALLLSELGAFQLRILLPLLLLVSLAIRFVGGSAPAQVSAETHPLAELAALGVIVVVALVLFFSPGEWATGDGDPGIYFNTAKHLARTGDINISDKEVASLETQDRLAFQSIFEPSDVPYIGFRLMNEKTGEFKPGLFHLFPAWIAIFIRLSGTKGGFYVSPLFALLGVLLVYCIGRRLSGRFGGLAASVLLCASSIQIWFSRIPAAEALQLFFIMASLLAVLVHFEQKARVVPLIFGLSFTCAILCKVEAALLIVPVVLTFLIVMLLGEYGKTDRAMVNAALAGAAVFTLYAWLFNYRYFIIVMYGGLYITPTQIHRNYILILLVALVPLVILFNVKQISGLAARIGRQVISLEQKLRISRLDPLRALAALTVLGVFVYLYTLPGADPDLAFVQNTRVPFLRMTWVMGGAFIFMTVIGFCWLVYRSNPPVSCFLFLCVLVFTVVFSRFSYGYGIIPWTARRYLPLVIPLLFIGTGFLAGSFWKLKNQAWKLVALAIPVVMLVALLPMSGLMLKNISYEGMVDQLDKAAEVEPDALVAMPDRQMANLFGIPMFVGYGQDYRWLRSDAENGHENLRRTVEKVRQSGRRFLVLSSSNDLYQYTPWIDFKETDDVLEFTTRLLVQTLTAPPSRWGVGLYKLRYYEAAASGPLAPKPGSSIRYDFRETLPPGLSAGFIRKPYVRGKLKQYPRGISTKDWRGVESGDAATLKRLSTNGGVSRLKLPIAGKALPMRLKITADTGSRGDVPMVLLVNGNKVNPVTVTPGNRTTYEFVVPTGLQDSSFQDIAFLVPQSDKSPGKGLPVPSAVRLLNFEAVFGE